jgi:hypothetical protein
MSTTTGSLNKRNAEDASPVFPFFVGCGRSGTSLLRAIFDSHPEMNVPRDTYFILGLASKRRRYERPEGFDVHAFVEDLTSGYDFTRWPVPFEEIADDLRAHPPQNYPDAIRQVFRVCAHKQGKTRYGNKSPVHVRAIGDIAELFPEARFVHIIRDGRNVALSYLDVDFGPKTLEAGALRWRRHVTSGRKRGRRLGADRYSEVRYEELTEDPERTIKQLCAFLDIAFDERMLRYYERSEDLYPGRETPKHHRNLAKPPTKGMRDWRTQLTPDKVAAFEAIGGGLLTELGYERGSPRPGTRARIRALGRVAGIEVGAALRRIGIKR